jgi:hypothetical protein
MEEMEGQDLYENLVGIGRKVSEEMSSDDSQSNSEDSQDSYDSKD